MASACIEVIDMSHTFRASLYPTPCPAADTPRPRHAGRALAYARDSHVPARSAHAAEQRISGLSEEHHRQRGSLTHRVAWPNWH
jgi:hypothetical protein